MRFSAPILILGGLSGCGLDAAFQGKNQLETTDSGVVGGVCAEPDEVGQGNAGAPDSGGLNAEDTPATGVDSDDDARADGSVEARPAGDAGCEGGYTRPSDAGLAGTPSLDASMGLADAGFEDVATWPAVTPPSDLLRLCSWNLKKLGHGESKDYETVAAIVDSECDAVVVLEVMQKGGTHPGYDDLMVSLGSMWTGLVTATPRPNTTSGNSEFYAVVWRAGWLTECEGWDGLRYVPDNDGASPDAGTDRFSREPAYGCFRVVGTSGELDFLLSGYHAIWGDGAATTISAEVAHLDAAVSAMKAARVGEDDVFVLGDFNLTPARLGEVSALSDWTEGTGSTLNSVGERTDNLYDHLLVHDPEATPELVDKASVLDVRGWTTSNELFFETVSDHLPVRVVLSLQQADDD